MGITRTELTRTQSSVITFYKSEIKELKKLYAAGELEKGKEKIELLERMRSLDYEVNNIMPIVKEKELFLKNIELDIICHKKFL